MSGFAYHGYTARTACNALVAASHATVKEPSSIEKLNRARLNLERAQTRHRLACVEIREAINAVAAATRLVETLETALKKPLSGVGLTEAGK